MINILINILIQKIDFVIDYIVHHIWFDITNFFTMQSNYICVCTTVPVAIVTRNSHLRIVTRSNGSSSDELIPNSGNILKELDLPVYCNIMIKKNGYIDASLLGINDPSIISKKVIITYISRRHVPLGCLETGYFYDNVTLKTDLGEIQTEFLAVNIGYGDKSDAENKKYCQDLLDNINNPDIEPVVQSVDPVELVAIELKIKNALKIIVCNFNTINENVNLKQCMDTLHFMFQTCKFDESNKTIAAYRTITTNYMRYQTTPYLNTCMQSVEYIAQYQKNEIEISNAIKLLMKYLAQYENSDSDIATILLILADLD